jgi:prolyl oligopeptidase
MLGLVAAESPTTSRIPEPSAEARLIFTVQGDCRALPPSDYAGARSWIDAQQRLTEKWLARVPQRGAVKDRLTRLLDRERFPKSILTNFSHGFTWCLAGGFSAGRPHFIPRSGGLQNQIALYTTHSDGDRDEVLLECA